MLKYTLIALLLSLISVNSYAQVSCPANSQTGIEVYNVESFHDGSSDHTQAFLDALECGKLNKVSVYVPRGNYVVNQPLELLDQSLIGEVGGTPSGNGSQMESLSTIHFNPNLPSDAVILSGASSIRGLTIKFNNTVPSESYQLPINQISTISVRGIGVDISDIKIYKPYCGICSAQTVGAQQYNVGRLKVDNVFIVSPQFGIKVESTHDVSRLNGIHIWEIGDTKPGSIGFWFKRNDYMVTSNLSVFNMATGFKFEDYIAPTGGGFSIISMSGTVTDFCHEGFDISGRAEITLSGGTIYNHFSGMKIRGDAKVQVTGAQFISNGAPVITTDENVIVGISGSRLQRDRTDFGHAAIHVNGAKMLTATSNTFIVAGHGVFFQNPVQKVANVSANTFDLSSNVHARAIWGTGGANLVSIGNSSTNN